MYYNNKAVASPRQRRVKSTLHLSKLSTTEIPKTLRSSKVLLYLEHRHVQCIIALALITRLWDGFKKIVFISKHQLYQELINISDLRNMINIMLDQAIKQKSEIIFPDSHFFTKKIIRFRLQ